MVNGRKSMNSHKLLGMIEKEAGVKIIKESKMVDGINTLATPPKLTKPTICVT